MDDFPQFNKSLIYFNIGIPQTSFCVKFMTRNMPDFSRLSSYNLSQ